MDPSAALTQESLPPSAAERLPACLPLGSARGGGGVALRGLQSARAWGATAGGGSLGGTTEGQPAGMKKTRQGVGLQHPCRT